MNLAALPLTYRATVPESYLDQMGHMNVMWYTHLFDQGTWGFFDLLGMNQAYFDAYQAGGFALEQHTRYLAEIRLGNSVAVYTRALGRSAKRIHFMHFMLLEHSGVLAATTELMGMHMDMAARRSSPMPEQITTAIDRYLAEHQRLDWPAPVCGVMKP
ncbi:MAG: thioesterase family protein [Chloroflexi bacterium]|nr:thioesterase family protein [Chloroflexota bacterium]MCI0645155.1 thioesterase family protein [Chloroflexota bacterium]MCI0725635.1 thioesterase family protein [Chloroflexota bacterium]